MTTKQTKTLFGLALFFIGIGLLAPPELLRITFVLSGLYKVWVYWGVTLRNEAPDETQQDFSGDLVMGLPKPQLYEMLMRTNGFSQKDAIKHLNLTPQRHAELGKHLDNLGITSRGKDNRRILAIRGDDLWERLQDKKTVNVVSYLPTFQKSRIT